MVMAPWSTSAPHRRRLAKVIGASGSVEIEAGEDTAVHVGSDGHTESVMVEGGASVKVDNGTGKQSMTVSSVSADGVAQDLPESTGERSTEGSHYNLKTDFGGHVLGSDGQRLTITLTTGEFEFKVVKEDDSKDDVKVMTSAGADIVDNDAHLSTTGPSWNLIGKSKMQSPHRTGLLPMSIVPMRWEFPGLKGGGAAAEV